MSFTGVPAASFSFACGRRCPRAAVSSTNCTSDSMDGGYVTGRAMRVILPRTRELPVLSAYATCPISSAPGAGFYSFAAALAMAAILSAKLTWLSSAGW